MPMELEPRGRKILLALIIRRIVAEARSQNEVRTKGEGR
jgi:hypothetical protein